MLMLRLAALVFSAANGNVTIKDLSGGEQTTVSRDQAASHIGRLLNREPGT